MTKTAVPWVNGEDAGLVVPFIFRILVHYETLSLGPRAKAAIERK